MRSGRRTTMAILCLSGVLATSWARQIHAAVALTMALGRAMVEYGEAKGLGTSLTIRSSDSRYASRRATRRKAHMSEASAMPMTLSLMATGVPG